MISLNSRENAAVPGEIIKTTDLPYTPEPGGMGKEFFSNMLRNGDAIAQIDVLTGEKDPYSNLLQRCIRTAIAMRSRGIKKGDIITICSYNHLNCCVPFIASLFLGAIPANLDPSIPLIDTIHLLKQVSPKAIFIVPESIELIENALKELGTTADIIVFGNSTKYLQFSEFLKETPEETNFKPVEIANLKETAIIFFSSGTTGLSKGICLHHLGLLSQSYQLIDLGFDTTVVQLYSPLFWISSLIFMGSAIMSKGCRLIIPKYDPKEVWNILEKYNVTTLFISPSQTAGLCKTERPKNINLKSFRHVFAAGGPIPKDQLVTLRKLLPEAKVLLIYAQTELIAVVTSFSLKKDDEVELAYKKPESSGRPVPGLTYKVVDPETEEILGPNQRGELRVKSEFQMNGYHNLDASGAIDSDGFIKTGDIVYYDEEKCFYVVDRIKEMMKFRSFHVPAAQLEAILLTHPAVEAAVALGLPHPEDGDHPMAFVVLKETFKRKIDPEEIKKYLDGQVDDRQRLRGGLKIIEKIPVTPSGKIRRNILKEMMLNGGV